MATPYIGEIRLIAGSFAPSGWADCDGRMLAISEYDTLFNLIGTTYGGDGQSTFALPDLRGRIPVHVGTSQGVTRILGEADGTETVTLASHQLPAHTHPVSATTAAANNGTPGNSVMLGAVANQTMYASTTVGGLPFTLNGQSVRLAGGSQPHENCMPTLCLRFCISLFGVYPSQN